MLRILVLAGALVAVASGVAAAGAQRESAAPKPQILQVAGRVSELSADGSRVAFRVSVRRGRCARVMIWTLPRRAAASSRPDCGHEVLVGELALAGTRALWVDYDAGTHRYCHLMTATTARPRPTELPECEHADPDRELHGLAGDGTMLAFNSWYDCTAPGQACSPGLRIHNVELWRVYRGRLKELGGIWSASPTVASVDAGRILLGPNPIVGLDASGKRLWSWFFHGLSARAVKLQGSQVAATIPCGIGSPGACGVIAYGTKTRTSGSVWRVPRDASLRDLQNGIAVYLAGGVAHVVRMSDGTDRAFHAAGGRPIADAELERPGLFYSYNATGGAKPGRIAFVPFADLMR